MSPKPAPKILATWLACEDADAYGLFVDMSALVKRGLRESQRDRGRCEGGRRERGRAGEREGRVGSEGRGMESVREIGRDRERQSAEMRMRARSYVS